jgi:hypothetical protein
VAWVEDRKLKWSVADGGQVRELPAEEKGLSRVSYEKPVGFTPGGKLMAVMLWLEAKRVNTIEFYDPATGARVPKPPYLLTQPGGGTVSPDGRLVAASDVKAVKVWEVPAAPGR